MRDRAASLAGVVRDRRRRYDVVIDACAASVGGGLTYARNLLPALWDRLGGRPALLLTSPGNDGELAASWPGERAVVPSPVPIRLLAQQALPLLFPRASILGTGNQCPLGPGAGRSVVIIQDTRFFGPAAREPVGGYERAQRWFSHRSVARAGATIAISGALADNIAHTVPRARGHILVAPSGAPVRLEPRPPDSGPRADPFILSLANGAAHKRLDLVVDGWARAAIPGLDLVMIGVVPEALEAGLGPLAATAAGSLILLGPIDDGPTLAWYLANAEALVSASEAEAYGLTPVEAGQHGCRTVVTDIAAHREVCGSRARYFAVGDADDLADQLTKALDEPSPRPWTVDTGWGDVATVVDQALLTVGDRR